jgi:hypothetical protein
MLPDASTSLSAAFSV